MKDKLAETFHRTAMELKLALDTIGDTTSDVRSYVLGCLFRETHREIDRLFKFSDDLTFASLSVRNLFELYLISYHVYFDEKALKKWYGQTHKDSKDLKGGFITLMQKKGFETRELEELQKFEDRALAESSFTSNGPFQMKNLAEKYGYADDYNFIYKLSSKLIHPTSMKVMGYEALSEGSNYLITALQVGAYFSHKYSDLVQIVVSKEA